MKNNTLLETLQESGLSENESRVYFAALSLGPATVLKIAQVAELKRTTVYPVIESLKHHGLMHVETKGFKKSYVVERPEKLESVLESRKERFKKLLPEFSALYNLKGGEGFIKYYEGLEAVKNVYDLLLKDAKPHDNHFVISDTSKWYTLDQNYFSRYRERRAKLNLNIKMLLENTKLSREDTKLEKQMGFRIKFLPLGTNLVIDCTITPQRVVIHQLTPPIMAIVIENKSIIQMQQQLFEIIWNSLSESK